MKKLLKLLILPALVVALAPAVAQAQTKIPVGMYEIVPDPGFDAGGLDVSSVTIEFTGEAMVATMQGQVLVKSSYKMEGDIMTLTDLEGQVACPTASKYQITVTDKGIRMKPVEDQCNERAAVLAQVTLVKRA